jgi:hypothetical protein
MHVSSFFKKICTKIISYTGNATTLKFLRKLYHPFESHKAQNIILYTRRISDLYNKKYTQKSKNTLFDINFMSKLIIHSNCCMKSISLMSQYFFSRGIVTRKSLI